MQSPARQSRTQAHLAQARSILHLRFLRRSASCDAPLSALFFSSYLPNHQRNRRSNLRSSLYRASIVGSGSLRKAFIRCFGCDPAKSDPLPEFLLYPPIQTHSSSRIRVGFLGHNEAYCEDNYLVGGYLCRVDWSPGDVGSSTKSDLVATIYFIVSLGCYGLLMVGIGLMHFPTCPQEALLLQQDIVEAKDFLKQRGVDVSSE